MGPSFKAVPNSQVKLQVSKYVLLESAIRPFFAEPVTNKNFFIKYQMLFLKQMACHTHKYNSDTRKHTKSTP